MMSHFTHLILPTFLVSACVCLLILATKSLHMKFAHRRADTSAVQAAHHTPTPRIGGLAILATLPLIALLLPPDAAPRFGLLVVSLFPVALAGFAEDLGWHIRPRNRLLAAIFSSLIAITLLGIWISHVDIPGFDTLLTWAPLAIAFTAFASAGICNGFNLIDGVNGLSSSVGLVAAGSMAMIAHQAGNVPLTEINLMLIGALLGFFVFNFPLGAIFLGDAGAYGLGHILSWLAISLMIRVPEVTPWAVLLIFFWPIADTFFAIYRRRIAGRPTDQPDRLHFHQLVMRALEITLTGRKLRRLTNPMSTVVMMPLFTAPAIAGVLLWDKPGWASVTLFAFGCLFVATYGIGLTLAQSKRLRPDCFRMRAQMLAAEWTTKAAPRHN